MRKPKETEPIELHIRSDADRGIIAITYRCTNCGKTMADRFFADKSIPEALGCIDCGAGLGGRPGGMFPLAGNEDLAN